MAWATIIIRTNVVFQPAYTLEQDVQWVICSSIGQKPGKVYEMKIGPERKGPARNGFMLNGRSAPLVRSAGLRSVF